MRLHSCATCRFRRYAERKPQSLVARLWRWHTGWCPGWRRYQARLAAEQPPLELHGSALDNAAPKAIDADRESPDAPRRRKTEPRP